MLGNSRKSFKTGDRVSLLKTGHHGRVAYEGKVKFRPGHWIGVVLDRPVGLNNGIVKGVRYFECKPRYGIFVPASALRIQPGKISSSRKSPQLKTKRSSSVQPKESGSSNLKTPLSPPITSSKAKSIRSGSVLAKSGLRPSVRSQTPSRYKSNRSSSTVVTGATTAAARRAKGRANMEASRASRPSSPRLRPRMAQTGSGSTKASQRNEEVAALKLEIQALKAELDAIRTAKSLDADILRVTGEPSQKAESKPNGGEDCKRMAELEAELSSSLRDFTQAAAQLKEAKQLQFDLKTRAEAAEKRAKVAEEKMSDALERLKRSEEANKGEEVAAKNKLESVNEASSSGGSKKEGKNGEVGNESAASAKEEEKMDKVEDGKMEEAKENGVEDVNKQISELKETVAAKERKIKRLIDAAEDHAQVMQREIQRKTQLLDQARSTNSKLKSQLTDSQKKSTKLLHQNKRLRIKASGIGKHSVKQGKMALAQFQKLDQKIKDLEYQIHYGENQSVKKIEELQAKLENRTVSDEMHKDARERIARLQRDLHTSKHLKAQSWLFSGQMEVV
ncbi:hypothetical protein AAMO2058_000740500 [Amorphochlora amoebiformis]|uniref:CAP-Gly domain-containing protein n=1 Tax=Amorphochlora amoebiformis TaxID=1561963 RepID=A0A7S0DNA8_9EUKA|mmetsp:Transcript_35406/g.57113  ORF Transcript_35406/g.57113 Transcript_35406/m.57113 type:complete len:562 (+) Transcript_35406:53-1738(+)